MLLQLLLFAHACRSSGHTKIRQATSRRGTPETLPLTSHLIPIHLISLISSRSYRLLHFREEHTLTPMSVHLISLRSHGTGLEAHFLGQGFVAPFIKGNFPRFFLTHFKASYCRLLFSFVNCRLYRSA